MARPTKTGLDYFPVDTDMDQDDKLCAIEASHPRGFEIAMKLLMAIYREGYFKPWSSATAHAFAGRKGIPVDDIKAVVATALEVGFFSSSMFNRFGIITSSGIQKRWIGGSQGRERICMYTPYVLVSPNEFRKSIRDKIVYSNLQNDYPTETPVFVRETNGKPGLSSGKLGFSSREPLEKGGETPRGREESKGREEREGVGGGETHSDPPPASSAGETPPAGQPATSEAEPEPDPEPAVPPLLDRDAMPAGLRRDLERRNRYKRNPHVSRDPVTTPDAQAPLNSSGPAPPGTPPDLDADFEEVPDEHA